MATEGWNNNKPIPLKLVMDWKHSLALLKGAKNPLGFKIDSEKAKAMPTPPRVHLNLLSETTIKTLDGLADLDRDELRQLGYDLEQTPYIGIVRATGTIKNTHFMMGSYDLEHVYVRREGSKYRRLSERLRDFLKTQ